MKRWPYVYEDEAIKVWDDASGEHYLTAKNRKLFQNCPIEYDTSTCKCLIYSDKEIPGLTLVDTDKVKQKNKIVRAEFDAMSVTIREV